MNDMRALRPTNADNFIEHAHITRVFVENASGLPTFDPDRSNSFSGLPVCDAYCSIEFSTADDIQCKAAHN
jgi:hypothetical protein